MPDRRRRRSRDSARQQLRHRGPTTGCASLVLRNATRGGYSTVRAFAAFARLRRDHRRAAGSAARGASLWWPGEPRATVAIIAATRERRGIANPEATDG